MTSVLHKRPIYISVTSLILANLVPLIGVLFFNWDLFLIFFIYWLESGIVGFYNLFKMWNISGEKGKVGIIPRTFNRLFTICFFMVHYGIFMFAHLTFVYSLFGGHPIPFVRIIIPFTSLFLSHGISFFVNFIGNEEFRKISLGQQMGQPYKRIFLMHFTILLGGFGTMIIGTPTFALVFMIILKMVPDLISHLKEHSALA